MTEIKSNISSLYFEGKFYEFEKGTLITTNKKLIEKCKNDKNYVVVEKSDFREFADKYKKYDLEDLRALCVERDIRFEKTWNKVKLIKELKESAK